jgi:hypothetical protein
MSHPLFNLCDHLAVFGAAQPVTELGLPLGDCAAVMASECLSGDQIDPRMEQRTRQGTGQARAP